MNMRLALAALLLTACDGVAPVDLHYVGSDGGDAGSDAHTGFIVDAGTAEPSGNDADPGSGPDGLCGCEFRAGESCCIPTSGAAFCTLNGIGCAQHGGVAIGCNGYDPNSESPCCWSGPPQPGSLTRYTSACVDGPTSCTTSADCNGGTCVLQKCGAVNISACDVTPACP